MAAFTNFIPVGSIIEFGIKNEQAQILEVLKNVVSTEIVSGN